MAKNKRRKSTGKHGPTAPPKNPKREEIIPFNNIVNGLSNAAGVGQRFIEQTDDLLADIDDLKKDKNRSVRFKAFLGSLGDYSWKQFERDIAQVELLRSRLSGEDVDPAEDIAAFRTWTEIEEYCAELDFDPRAHGTLREAKAALLDLFSSDEDEGN